MFNTLYMDIIKKRCRTSTLMSIVYECVEDIISSHDNLCIRAGSLAVGDITDNDPSVYLFICDLQIRLYITSGLNSNNHMIVPQCVRRSWNLNAYKIIMEKTMFDEDSLKKKIYDMILALSKLISFKSIKRPWNRYDIVERQASLDFQ